MVVEKKHKQVIGLASDHAGFHLKSRLIDSLVERGYEIVDFGCSSDESCDYPDYAHSLAKALTKGEVSVGISLCGSGNGINMVVNKYQAIRSALCWNVEIAALARAHNDANICALPARFLTSELALNIVNTFLTTGFDGGRHLKRILKIPVIEG